MFDRYQRKIEYVRISLTDRCNLRCRYCMPDGAKIPEHEEVLTHEEFLRLAALFAQCGIDTVRVTGGEPLVRKSVAQLVAGLKATPGIRHVSMTTNGTLLAQQLPALLDAGLDSVNISLDTLDPAVFRHITARDEFAAVQAGLRAALESPLPVKLNCVPQVGVNEGELEAIAALARDNDLQVRFIEMMPIGYGAAMPCVSGPELRARFANRWPELHPVEGTTFGNGPAVYYTVPGWKGSIGFIAAVHGKFCVSCNRVRLTSQGFLRPCLASETGCDLRALLRSGADDPEMAEIAEECKQECYDLFVQAAQQEKDWADYLFRDGSMIGLNKDILCQYVEYITNIRMQAVGLDLPFQTRSNPIPWINTWLVSDNVQVAPQEVEVSSYLVGQIDAEVDTDDLSNFQL